MLIYFSLINPTWGRTRGHPYTVLPFAYPRMLCIYKITEDPH